MLHDIAALRLLNQSQLRHEVDSISCAIFELQFSLQLDPKHNLKPYRRQRARILTVMREQQLNLLGEPNRMPSPTKIHKMEPDRIKKGPLFHARLAGSELSMHVGRRYELVIGKPQKNEKRRELSAELFSMDAVKQTTVGQKADYILRAFSDHLNILGDSTHRLRKYESLAIDVVPLRPGRCNLDLLVFTASNDRLLQTLTFSMKVFA
jgi:ribosomal protein L29